MMKALQGNTVLCAVETKEVFHEGLVVKILDLACRAWNSTYSAEDWIERWQIPHAILNRDLRISRSKRPLEDFWVPSAWASNAYNGLHLGANSVEMEILWWEYLSPFRGR